MTKRERKRIQVIIPKIPESSTQKRANSATSAALETEEISNQDAAMQDVRLLNPIRSQAQAELC